MDANFYSERGRNCQKFQEKYKFYNDSEKEAILFLKLRKEGCSRKTALNFSSKNVCRSDSTRTLYGPPDFRTLKVKQVPPNSHQKGWVTGCLEYEIEKRFQQGVKDFIEDDSQEKHLQKIFDEEEEKAKQEFKRVLKIMKEYFEDISANKIPLPQGCSKEQFLRSIKKWNEEVRQQQQSRKQSYFELNNTKFYMLAQALIKMREEDNAINQNKSRNHLLEGQEKTQIGQTSQSSMQGLINKYNVFNDVLRDKEIFNIQIKEEVNDEIIPSPKLKPLKIQATMMKSYSFMKQPPSIFQSPESNSDKSTLIDSQQMIASDYPKEPFSTLSISSYFQSSRILPKDISNIHKSQQIYENSKEDESTPIANEKEDIARISNYSSKEVNQYSTEGQLLKQQPQKQQYQQLQDCNQIERFKKASLIDNVAMQLQLLQDMDMTNQDLFASTPHTNSRADETHKRMSCISVCNQRLLEEQFNQAQYFFKKDQKSSTSKSPNKGNLKLSNKMVSLLGIEEDVEKIAQELNNNINCDHPPSKIIHKTSKFKNKTEHSNFLNPTSSTSQHNLLLLLEKKSQLVDQFFKRNFRSQTKYQQLQQQQQQQQLARNKSSSQIYHSHSHDKQLRQQEQTQKQNNSSNLQLNESNSLYFIRNTKNNSHLSKNLNDNNDKVIINRHHSLSSNQSNNNNNNNNNNISNQDIIDSKSKNTSFYHTIKRKNLLISQITTNLSPSKQWVSMIPTPTTTSTTGTTVNSSNSNNSNNTNNKSSSNRKQLSFLNQQQHISLISPFQNSTQSVSQQNILLSTKSSRTASAANWFFAGATANRGRAFNKEKIPKLD